MAGTKQGAAWAALKKRVKLPSYKPRKHVAGSSGAKNTTKVK